MAGYEDQTDDDRVDSDHERLTAVGGDMSELLAMAVRHCGDAGSVRELREDTGAVTNG